MYSTIRQIVYISIFWCIGFLSNISTDIYAYTSKWRSLPWIDIIKRADWITDESIIFKKTTTVVQDNEDKDEEIATTKSSYKVDIRTKYLRSVFLDQYTLDGIIRQVSGKDLIRSRGYKKDKTHIVVHHTVHDLEKIKTIKDAVNIANNIFKTHTQKKGRWDIGYNFIIDPWGNIYEGRWGWESVVGAHALHNNAASLGIALIGNFEINEPTKAQLNALAKLSTALMIRYRINPDSEIYAHIEDNDHEPYVKDVVRASFIGHRDTGKTACPGKNLYSKLPLITQAIRTQLLIQKKSFAIKKVRKIYNQTTTSNFDTDRGAMTIPQSITNKVTTCKSYNINISVSCKKTNKWVSITFNKKKDKVASGILYIDLNTNKKDESYKFIIPVSRKSDEALLLTQRRDAYIKANKISPSKNSENKFKKAISLTEISDLTKKDVNVLLYEASTTLSSWKFLCQQCTATDDKWLVYTDSTFTITNNGISLTYTSKNQTATINSITIQPKKSEWVSFITNYGRKSYGWIAWNNFYGKLTISQQPIKKLWESAISTQYVIVNTLPFDRYMRGIIESNDTEPTEKIKVMTLLAKNYILFYLDPAHRHPSIPEWTNYNAVDDARIFQKYVWAGVDSTLKLWRPALESTKNQIVTYDNNLAFLSYFSCSAGFTRSAKEKRWLQDTPYLVSVYDPAPCKDFNGHGVGLAGNGATKLANDGKTYKDIIQHFYPWVTIETY